MDGAGRTAMKNYLHDYTYNGPEVSLEEGKKLLVKFSTGDGRVDLKKNTANGIAEVCLNHPRIRNAINGKMVSDLEDIIVELEQWTECKAVLLYGADGNFCSGGDLNLMKKINTPEMGFAMSTYVNHVLERFRKMPVITAAYIDGSGAMGGGAEFTTACDYRLMCSETPDATGIGFVHATMGIVPAWGSTGRLVSIVGRQTALHLLLDCRPLRAAEAMAVGLVDGTVRSKADAVQWLCRKTRHDANVIKAVKRTLLCHYGGGEADFRTERRIFAPLWGGPANKEALSKNFKHDK